MTSPSLSTRAPRAAGLGLLALLLWPALAAATPTTVSGQQYADECKLAGVPPPPDWDVQKTEWVYKGDQEIQLQPDDTPIAKVYLHKSYDPQGICVALPRTAGNGSVMKSMNIICQGHTGKVCFWRSTEPFTTADRVSIVTGSGFKGGKALENGLVCTSCHTGENPFIVHPGTKLDLKDSKGVSILNSGIWPDPLVPAGWPQNPPPATGLSQCTSCHARPTSWAPSLAGRLPELNSSMGSFCSIVMNPMLDRGIMPPNGLPQHIFATDIAAIRAKCQAPPPSGPPARPVEMAEAFKGRFVFGDQDNNVYAIQHNGNLLHYKHSGAADGTNHWNIAGKVVGTKWAKYRKVFTAGRGVIYAINGQNQLTWHKHLGQVAGTNDWAPGSGSVVGYNWNANQVFATTNGDGVIYAVSPDNGNLLWYKHTGYTDGTYGWGTGSGNVVGYGWKSLSRLMAGPDGVIYGVNAQNNLVWTRHLGLANGTFNWAPNTGAVVGWSWYATTMFTGSQGRIYALAANGDLHWYRQVGYLDGTASWVDNYARLVGTGWEFMPQPYFD